jgi:hypothetical protein
MNGARREIAPNFRQWIAAVTTTQTVEVKQFFGGASHEAWFVDVNTDAGAHREQFGKPW